ncbi:MAG: heat-inducible transcriptional repressor HrcA [Oscillospiraceae bacterium]|nr:heat-inducible transcriptional repressor HrcA [Oscillospiraceae bacterium]
MRKKKILQAIIDEFFDTAEPVGSRYIARKHELGLSSATIRNEMSDLEEMGYLAQPHASSGRVPSDKGYRLYVDDIMEVRELTIDEIREVTDELTSKIGEINQLLKRASAVMSRFTKYTTISTTSSFDDSTVKTIKIVQIENRKLYVILASSSGAVKNSLAYLPFEIDAEDVARLSDIFHGKLFGKSISELSKSDLNVLNDLKVLNDIKDETGVHEAVLEAIVEALYDCLGQLANSEIVFDGATKILNFPEFRNVEKVKRFLEMLEEKKNIANIVHELSRKGDVKVLIGDENPIEEFRNCSIVSTAFNAGNVVVGTIGVIGPKRMDYQRVVSTLEYINKVVSHEISKLVGEYDEKKER